MMRNGLQRTSAETKTYATTTVDNYRQQQFKKVSRKGDLVPVYVAMGMIAVSSLLGLYTAKHELMYSPTVYVKKKRRETLPEVVEPEHVVEETDKFRSKSFFRKVAHIQKTHDDHQPFIKGTQHGDGDALAYPHRIETLKDVGVDPIPHH